MAIRFIIGRAGSGKTQHCVRSIIEQRAANPLGPPIFWILPRQATFSAERELITAPGVKGFTGVWVISFDQLATEILTECGGLAAPITALAREMLLGRLLRSHEKELRYFGSVARQSGLAQRLGATFDEFERSGRSANDLAEVLGTLDQTRDADYSNSSLAEKLHDLHLLYSSYENFLGQERLDPRRRTARMLACIDRSKVLREAQVFVDGFIDYTDMDRRILAELAKHCPSVEVTALLDPASPAIANPDASIGEMSTWHRVERSYRQLHRAFTDLGADIQPPLLLTGQHHAKSSNLRHLERVMTDSAPAPEAPDGSIRLIEACDPRAEVYTAARLIRQHIAAGHRLRDMLVLTRDLESYHDLITAAFAEHHLPFFADRRRAAGHHPLVRLVRAALRAIRGDWPHEWLIELMKTGLAGLTLDDAEDVEAYVLTHRLRGARWADDKAWEFDRAYAADDDASPPAPSPQTQVDALRRKFISPLVTFRSATCGEKAMPLKQIVKLLFNLLEACNVRKTLTDWIRRASGQARLEEAEEHEQTWAKLVNLFDQMADVLGDELLPLSEFSEILDTGLESFDLGLVPPAIDQVLVGEIERTRVNSAKFCIVLGMSEGIFPRASHSNNVFSDGDRRLLERMSIELDADGARRTLDEALLAYFAFTRGSHQLILIRPTASARGLAIEPSPFWNQVRDAFDGLEVTASASPGSHHPADIATRRQLVESVLTWRRLGQAADVAEQEVETLAALSNHLKQTAEENDELAALFRDAVPSLSCRNRAVLSPDIAAQIFRSPLKATPRQIESFAACPFQHFAGYGLNLAERPPDEVSGADMSGAYHRLLESIVGQLVAQKIDLAQLGDEPAKRLIARLSNEVSLALQSRMMLTDARRGYLLQHIERAVTQFIESQRLSLAQGGMRPVHAGVRFGEGQKLPQLEIVSPSGQILQLRGVIDRIDVALQSAEFAVIDYRLSGNALSLQHVYHGLSLQLLTYLLVIQSHGDKLTGQSLTPVAAFYLGVMRKIEMVQHPQDAGSPDDALFFLRAKPRGIVSAGAIGAFDNALSTGRSEVINAQINKTGTPGNLRGTDVAPDEDFMAILANVRDTLAKLTDRIVSGEITVQPYRLGRATPCSACNFRSVCRFEVGINHYLPLESMDRTQALAKLTGKETGDAE